MKENGSKKSINLVYKQDNTTKETVSVQEYIDQFESESKNCPITTIMLAQSGPAGYEVSSSVIVYLNQSTPTNLDIVIDRQYVIAESLFIELSTSYGKNP